MLLTAMLRRSSSQPVSSSIKLLALSLTLFATGSAAAVTADEAFATAYADLARQHEAVATTGSTVAEMTAINEAFFRRINAETLSVRQIAEVARQNAFAYGDGPKAQAKTLAERLEPMAAAPDEEGALAAVLLVMLSGPAGKGPQRAGWEAAALHHPAYIALLQGEYGGFALEVACLTAPRDDVGREFFLGLPAQFSATKSPAVAGLLKMYWSRVSKILPEGEKRQAIRQQLVDYLDGALGHVPAKSGDAATREKIQTLLDFFNGASVRGQLTGNAAPELHFLWTSEGAWKSIVDLRGKVVVLDFWATWCGPCVESFPKIAQLVEHYRGADVVILGVTSLQGTIIGLRPGAVDDCRENPEKEMRLMGEYIKTRGLTWPVVISREALFNPDYGVEGVPTMVLIAPDGTVRQKHMGLGDPTKITGEIDALLTEFKLRAPTAPSAATK